MDKEEKMAGEACLDLQEQLEWVDHVVKLDLVAQQDNLDPQDREVNQDLVEKLDSVEKMAALVLQVNEDSLDLLDLKVHGVKVDHKVLAVR